MLVPGLVALGLVVAIVAIFPRAKVGLVVTIALALLFLHPYIIGLPWRVGEIIFAHQIHKGMTRSEVIALAVKYGGTGLGSRALAPDDDPQGGFLSVQFLDWASLCVGGGREFDFHFYKNGTLAYREVGSWSGAC